jgi:hypothetical protein
MSSVWKVLAPFVTYGIVALLFLLYLYMDFMHKVDANYVHVGFSLLGCWMSWMKQVSAWQKALVRIFMDSACKCWHTRVFGFVGIYSVVMVDCDLGKVVWAIFARFFLMFLDMGLLFFRNKMMRWWDPSTTNTDSVMFETGAMHYILIFLTYTGEKPEKKRMVLTLVIQALLCFVDLTEYESIIRLLLCFTLFVRTVQMYHTASWVDTYGDHMKRLGDFIVETCNWTGGKLKQFAGIMWTVAKTVCGVVVVVANCMWKVARFVYGIVVVVATWCHKQGAKVYTSLKHMYDARRIQNAPIVHPLIVPAASANNASPAIHPSSRASTPLMLVGPVASGQIVVHSSGHNHPIVQNAPQSLSPRAVISAPAAPVLASNISSRSASPDLSSDSICASAAKRQKISHETVVKTLEKFRSEIAAMQKKMDSYEKLPAAPKTKSVPQKKSSAVKATSIKKASASKNASKKPAASTKRLVRNTKYVNSTDKKTKKKS